MPMQGRIAPSRGTHKGKKGIRPERELMRSILEVLHLTRFSPSVLALAGATAIAATTLLGGTTMATLSHATVVPSDPFKIATMNISEVRSEEHTSELQSQ